MCSSPGALVPLQQVTLCCPYYREALNPADSSCSATSGYEPPALHTPRCPGQHWMGGFAPTSKVSAKRAEKQQDCTKSLMRAILESALNEIKLLGLDPSQCNPWGADTAICTLIYWALELFSVWFMAVNCVLANVHSAKLSVPSAIKNQKIRAWSMWKLPDEFTTFWIRPLGPETGR